MMPCTKFLSMPVFMLLFTYLSACSTTNEVKNREPATQDYSLKVATATPVVASMAKELTDNTPISIVYLPPKHYSIKRIPAWLKRQNIDSYPSVDAVAGISSVWPQVSIYPILRSHNIGVIPIDMANAYMPGGERVAITPPSSSAVSYAQRYFWLNPANALIMVGILHRDLTSVVQQSNADRQQKHRITEQLSVNLTHITKSLRTSQLTLDQALVAKDIMQVAVSTPELSEIGAASLLPLFPLEDIKASDFPGLFITHKKRGHRSLRELPPHILVWHIDDFTKNKGPRFTKRWKIMIQSLVDAQAIGEINGATNGAMK